VPEPSDRAQHDELCFGCGHANLFGLQLELERGDGGVSGCFFVKQGHQGPDGAAHPGVLTAALEEAMALTASAWPGRVEVWLAAPAPVGSFVTVTAWLEPPGVSAAASGEHGEMLAEAYGTLS
jgi:hypothetical protein